MSYVTQQDLVDRFGDPELIAVTDRAENSSGEIDSVMIAAAIEEAESEVNSYLAKIVATPLDPVPAKVKAVTIDIVRYRLCRENRPDNVKDDYNSATAWLKMAAAGAVSLGNADTATAPATAGEPDIDTGCRTFDRDSMRDF